VNLKFRLIAVRIFGVETVSEFLIFEELAQRFCGLLPDDLQQPLRRSARLCSCDPD
jgi:hypothetical protein